MGQEATQEEIDEYVDNSGCRAWQGYQVPDEWAAAKIQLNNFLEVPFFVLGITAGIFFVVILAIFALRVYRKKIKSWYQWTTWIAALTAFPTYWGFLTFYNITYHYHCE